MAKKIKLKTRKLVANPLSFLKNIKDDRLKNESLKLMKLFQDTTGLKPKMWGASIVGFGEYTYYRSNGHEGQFFATGFSPRKSGPTIYVMPGVENYKPLLKMLGPHKHSKSCLYLKSLEGINQKILSKLIKAGMQDLKKTHSTNY